MRNRAFQPADVFSQQGVRARLVVTLLVGLGLPVMRHGENRGSVEERPVFPPPQEPKLRGVGYVSVV